MLVLLLYHFIGDRYSRFGLLRAVQVLLVDRGLELFSLVHISRVTRLQFDLLEGHVVGVLVQLRLRVVHRFELLRLCG